MMKLMMRYGRAQYNTLWLNCGKAPELITENGNVHFVIKRHRSTQVELIYGNIMIIVDFQEDLLSRDKL